MGGDTAILASLGNIAVAASTASFRRKATWDRVMGLPSRRGSSGDSARSCGFILEPVAHRLGGGERCAKYWHCAVDGGRRQNGSPAVTAMAVYGRRCTSSLERCVAWWASAAKAGACAPVALRAPQGCCLQPTRGCVKFRQQPLARAKTSRHADANNVPKFLFANAFRANSGARQHQPAAGVATGRARQGFP